MSFLGLSSFGLKPEARMDQAEGDAARNTSGGATDPNADLDESPDAKAADGVDSGNGQGNFGPTVSAPKVATATSKSFDIQHGPAASRVKP